MKPRCKCGRILHPARLYPLYCVCGHKHLGEPVSSPPRSEACTHLGEQVGIADCDCATKPRVYVCDLHGICLPRMTVTAAVAKMDDGTRATVRHSCIRCSDYAAKA